jgi:hypothetical protein
MPLLQIVICTRVCIKIYYTNRLYEYTIKIMQGLKKVFTRLL